MNYSEIWLTFAPKEFLEITDFLEKIRKNNPNDLEVAMKSREKILEIQEKVLENNFVFPDFGNFFNTEREKFFAENPILDEKKSRSYCKFFRWKIFGNKKIYSRIRNYSRATKDVWYYFGFTFAKTQKNKIPLRREDFIFKFF